ncbi:RluA family pseudouridine synthase [Candidatus Odyssella acanthamoebae]|uniref:RluA family pseudouridine synthase n=1 Tax=Candidatus Odyssella acanthamoebae TaxID=91604 RepID=UPI000570000E|nr:RluA family pseudouridine synthase [Candidatus Paracaedibacter acanthamoebae]
MQNKSDTYSLIIDACLAGQRLDKALSKSFPHLSRTRIQGLIDTGRVEIIPHRKISSSMKLLSEDRITFTIPAPEEATPSPQAISLDIIYEDADLLVINKAAGMVVHPAPGHRENTLVNALLAHCGDSLSGIGGVKRPGIVHRLDKDTSGLMVVAKNDFAHHALSAQFSDRSLSRTYIAFVWGVPNPRSGTIQTLIGRHPRNRQKMAVLTHGGREAVTHYEVLTTLGNSEDLRLNISVVQCKLATGRTHQIRVHMLHLGHPLIGDPLYGHSPKGATAIWTESMVKFPRQALHAKEISFLHPTSGKVMHFVSQLPVDLVGLEKL